MTLSPKRILILAVIALTLPVFAASPEYLVGGTVPTPAPSSRGPAAVATDGTGFLATWVDFRASTVRSLVATRVTRDGQVLDPLGIRIDSTTGGILSVEMVWDGEAYLVVWTTWSQQGFGSRHDLYAARLDRDGSVIMQPRTLVENALLTSFRAVATNGNVTLVSYYNNAYPYGVWIAAIGRDGHVLHREPLPIGSGESGFALAATSSRFLLTWSETHGVNVPSTIHALSLPADGHVTGFPVQLGEGEFTAVGTDGSRFLVVSIGADVESRVLDGSLNQIGDTETITTDPVSPVMTVLWRAGRYEVNYTVASNAFTTEVDANGHLVTKRTRDKPGAVAATNGSDVLLLFGAEVSTSTFPQIFAALYRGNAPVADDYELLSWSGNGHAKPVIAASAQHGHLVAWDEESGVYFTRVDAQGNSLDGRGILIGQDGWDVRVAFDGTNYVAAWLEPGGYAVRRIAPATGATVADVHVQGKPWFGLAVAASPEATYLALAEDGIHVFVTRIPHATSVPDAVPVQLTVAHEGVVAPAVSWNGSTLLVAWNETYWPPRADPPNPFPIKILASRVTATLAVLDAEPLVVGSTDGTDWHRLNAPAIASDGDGWLVVSSTGWDYEPQDIVARRVQSNGTLEGNGMQHLASGANPAVTWDGTRYALAWKDNDNIRLGAVAATGPLAAMRRTTVAMNAAPGSPAIAPAANQQTAVIYTKLSLLPQHGGVERTFLRFMDYPQPRGRGVRR